MPINLRLAIFVVTLILSFIIISVLKKDKIPVRYSILWWLVVAILLLLVIFPKLFIYITNLLGFQTISNMVVGIFIIILLFITISLTIIVSGQRKKIALLIQEVSMLKGCNNEKKSK